MKNTPVCLSESCGGGGGGAQFRDVTARVAIGRMSLANCRYKKVLEMPIALNPETSAIFRQTVNPKDVTYKNRLKKLMIESPTIEL